MPLVAKRKLTETWRDAVARRGGEFDREKEVVRAYEAHLIDGKNEAEAAYMTLADFNCLFIVPDGPMPGRREEI